MHTRYLTAIVVASILCIQSSCVKEEINNTLSIALQIPFSVSPARDTITLGESLILESIFSTSDSLRDSRSGQMFAIKDDFIMALFGAFYYVNDPNITYNLQEGNLLSYVINDDIGTLGPLGHSRWADVNFEKVGSHNIALE